MTNRDARLLFLQWVLSFHRLQAGEQGVPGVTFMAFKCVPPTP